MKPRRSIKWLSRLSRLAVGAAALCAVFTTTNSMAVGDLRVQQLRCEYAADPLGIDVPQPRLSWVLESRQRGQMQTAYRILVASSADALRANQGDLWDTGKVKSDQSVQVVYAGRPLVSRQRCFWKVLAWDKEGQVSAFSPPASWEMGLLNPSDWEAEWIGLTPDPADQLLPGACPFFRKTIDVPKKISQARLYATALGVYEFHINGQRVGRDIFTPGWTDYQKRVQYQTYDVTALLHAGRNALGLILGDGWYAGHVGASGRNRYGKMPLALGQIILDYSDGSTETIVTDASWKATFGPLAQSDMLMGETYDARREIPGWDQVDFPSFIMRHPAVQPIKVPLVASCDAPVRKIMELRPRTMTEPEPGVFVLDLGQNMVGWARLKVKGPAGTTVTLRFAEMLNPDGTIYTANLRSAKCTDIYTLKGGAEETYEPHLTFHGFRYMELTGFPGRPSLGSVTGIVISSDTPPSGKFECSNPLINQLQSNIVWGQRGNFISIPTDCPQRDERLGWMGDAQIFARTATFNTDVSRFFTKWLADVDDAQRVDGAFTDVSPFAAAGAGTAAWGDAGVICPWTIYLVYGDTRILEKHYAAGAKWIAYLKSRSKDLLRPAQGYGDWLSIQADTPKDVLATAYFACSTRLMAQMAQVLGKTADAKKYEDLFQQIKAAFNQAYVAEDGRIKGNTQTCYVLALDFDLLPDDKRDAAAKFLTDDIAAKHGHLSTGFVGVGHLMPTLTRAGFLNVAYQLLNNDTFPSWLYSIRQGATTIWERWDGWTKEKGFQDPGMNSFNHYSLGSVGAWMYDTVAGLGLDPEKPGFKHILIHPQPGGSLTHARAEYDSIHGKIISDWRIANGRFTLNVTIPANTTATVYVPSSAKDQVKESDRPAENSPGVKFLRQEKDSSLFEIGSGTYRFSVPQF
jgi:alpha-L-rhamnosidase